MATDYLESNLAQLKRFHPDLAQRLEGLADEPEPKLVPLAGGLFDLERQGSPVYGGKPMEAARKTIQSIDFTYPKLLVFYGVGLGYHVTEFFKIPNPVSSAIVIIEKSLDVFKKALRASDWGKAFSDRRVRFIVGVPENRIGEALSDFLGLTGAIVYVQALGVVVAPNACREEQDYYVHAAKTFKEVVASRSSALICSPEDAYQGFMNIINNLPNAYGVPAIDSLKGSLKGLTGIVVSSGPSLKRSIPWLKQVGDRAVIACADSALKTLIDNGIKPHFTGGLERTPSTTVLFDGMPPTPDTWLVTNPVLYPKTYKAYQGPKLHLIRPIGQLKWFFPDNELLDTGRSVAHLNYVTLRELGCSKIVLVGQDLAYDRATGSSHSEGVHPFLLEVGEMHRKQALQATQSVSDSWVEGNDGQPILTTRWYKEFKETFEGFFRQDGATAYNVIPADCGAKINYTTRVDPEQALSLIPEESHPIRQTIRRVLASQRQESYAEYAAIQSRRIDVALENLKKFKYVSMEVMDALSEHFFLNNPEIYGDDTARYRTFFKKIEHITNTLFNSEDDFYFYFVHAMTMDRIISVSQALQGVLGDTKLSNAERLEKQFNCIMNWFHSAHLWCSRMESYIQKKYPTLFAGASPDKSSGAQHASP